MQTFTPKLILHGGAWNIPLELEEAHAKGLEAALSKVYPLLLTGKYDAMQAVVDAIKILEDDPTYDAGKGSFLNMKGEVEMDASLMDGTTMKSGAVACIQNVMHPIEVAQNVLQKTDHVLLVGRGALEFAKANGIPEVDPMDLLTEREIEFLKHIRENKEFKSVTVFDPKESQFSSHTIQESLNGTTEKTEGQSMPSGASSHDLYEEKRQHKMGTVGAVALDIHGNIVAGTSTGGVPKKLPGRSGDSPIVGSGTFADSSVAGASATGFGESIMTVQMTSTAIRWLEFNNIPQKYAKTEKVFQSNIYPTITQGQLAAQAAVQYLEDKVKGLGGLIMISKEGNEGKYAATFNTGKMAVAYVETKQERSSLPGDYRFVSMVANREC